jgi:hypothetical protein
MIEVWAIDSGNRLAEFKTWPECDQWLVDLSAANPEGIGHLVCGETWEAEDRIKAYWARHTGASNVTIHGPTTRVPSPPQEIP